MHKVSRSSSSWPQLPNTMFELICNRLSLGEVLKAAEVCKDWRSMTGDLKLTPCLMYRKTPGDENKTFFFDPLSETHEELREDLLGFMDNNTSILHLKDGWLLMRERLEDERGNMLCFFLNPLTKTRIDLPVFEKHVGKPFSFAFSSAPTSNDCVVVGITGVADGSQMLIRTCRRGEQEWKDIVVENNIPFTFFGNFSQTVHHNGCFYTMNVGGEICIFEVGSGSEHTWTVLSKPKVLEVFPNDDLHHPCIYGFQELCFVTSKEDDELFLLLAVEGSVHVFKLIDRWKNEWKEVKKLEGNVYIGRHGSFFTKGDRTNSSDKIYFDTFGWNFLKCRRPPDVPRYIFVPGECIGGLWIEFDLCCPPEEQISW